MTKTEIKYHPMLFSTLMVQSILEGLKTQTRRIVKGTALDWLEVSEFTPDFVSHPDNYLCPCGKVGDVIWGRETFYAYGGWALNPVRHTKKGNKVNHFHDFTLEEGYAYNYDTHFIPDPNQDKNCVGWHKRPSLFMPKEACRLFLELTNIRIEKLQGISREDAIKEGIVPLLMSRMQAIQEGQLYRDYSKETELLNDGLKAVESYKSLWEKINGKGSWDENPWVWVYDFKVIDKPENFLNQSK